jgi:hypothetical protein
MCLGYPVTLRVPRIKDFATLDANKKPKPEPRIIQKSISPGVPHESSTHARRIAPQSIF